MAVSVTCTNAVRDPSNGHISITWSDGHTQEFNTASDIFNQAVEMDADAGRARLWLLADWMRLDPGANDFSRVIGKICALNAASESRIVISQTVVVPPA